jgi:hypothetical protein
MPTPELNKALAAFQAELPPVAKAATADTGSYRYDYADLEDVSKVVLPLLGKHGLAFTACPGVRDDGKQVLAYALVHASGEERCGQYLLPDKASAQQMGSAITYARRYSLLAVTGVAPGGEDDDGHAAQGAEMKTAHGDPQHVRLRQPEPAERVNGRRPATRSNSQGQNQWQDLPPEDQPGSATEQQVRGISITYSKMGFKTADRDRVHQISEHIIGRPLGGPADGKSHKNLSYNEARKLADTLDSTDRARLEDDLAAAAS